MTLLLQETLSLAPFTPHALTQGIALTKAGNKTDGCKRIELQSVTHCRIK